jgi:hypothetical protein
MPTDKQTVVRTNRDTPYSTAVFDLDASPISYKRHTVTFSVPSSASATFLRDLVPICATRSIPR